MHELILLIIIGAVGVVLLLQFGVVTSLKKELEAYRHVLFPSYEFDDQEESYHRIRSAGGQYSHVLNQLNRYLEANNRTVPNFEILKDIIERHTVAAEDRIRALLPIPLYYGLSGTILGIILGIIPLAMSSQENPLSDFPMLLSGVAIAMAGSFVGVVITSWANQSYKSASVEHEECKNALYSFIQIELFPVMSNNPAGPMAQLVRALGSFTDDFSSSAETMQEAANDLADTFDTQKQLLELTKQLSDAGIAKQNLLMAKEMSQYVDIVNSFNTSISGMQTYVDRLVSVTSQLQSSTEYLTTLQSLTSILSTNDQVISYAVAAQKRSLEDGINGIQQVTNSSLTDVREQQQIMLDDFGKAMNDSLVKFEQYLKENQTIPAAVESLSDATTKLLPELLGKLSERLDALQQSQETQAKALVDLANAQRKLATHRSVPIPTPTLPASPSTDDGSDRGNTQSGGRLGMGAWWKRVIKAITDIRDEQ